jgi:hypothetical protein
MANLEHLGAIKPTEPLDLENYADNRESKFQLPPKGIYTLTVRSEFPQEAFGRTKSSGALSAEINPTIVGPAHEGFTMRYIKVSATPFKRDGKTVSQLGDFLRSCGYSGTVKDEQEQADAVEQQAGQVFEAELDWRAYNSKTKLNVEGMSNFPKLEDGTYQSWIADPNDTDEKGAPKRVPARLYIRRFIPMT